MTRRVLLFTVIVGCLSNEVYSYSPEQDDEAMAAITRHWSDASLTISLCEDTTAGEGANCQVEHVVRGGGRGKRDSSAHGGGGCGGCPLANLAHVKGTVTGGGFAAPVEVVGEVSLGSFAEDPYAFPYDVNLRCTAAETPCFLRARLLENGTLEMIDAADQVSAQLAPAGPATCP